MNEPARPGLITSPAAVRAAVAAIGIRPSRALGQNFLIDRNVRDCIVKASAPREGEQVLEIGPGLGVLTDVLVERASRLVAVEKDHRLADWLRERFRDDPRVDVLCEDALETDLACVMQGVSSVVSNLPYVTGSRILVRLIQDARRPERIAVTVQLEVAERLVAAPGSGDYGLLAVWAQHDYSVRIERKISPTCFWPVPEVTSALVTLARLPRVVEVAADDAAARATFYAATRQAFQHRRKRLTNALAAGHGRVDGMEDALRRAGIDGSVRPETLSPDEWWSLAVALTTIGGVGT
jgi:16S rRNA (adenine1518-N6/adenine1519-N6)-dimethyltransferase